MKNLRRKFQLRKETNYQKFYDVNFGGLSLTEKKYKLAKKYGIKIIEDLSHCIGSSNEFEKVDCKWSDINIFSFHPVKIITTGEGGLATTNSSLYAKRLKLYREHGISSKNRNFWSYSQKELGYNYRMNEISASLELVS